MCSRFLKSGKEAHHGRIYLFAERMFDRLLAGYEWGLKRVLKFQLLTLCVFLLTLILTVVLYVLIPKGFFPEQDTGMISGQRRGGAGRLLGGDVGSSRRDGQDRRCGSGRCRRGLHRGLLGLQHRQLLHHLEAGGAAQGERRPDHRPAAPQAGRPSRAPISFSRCRRTSRSAAAPARPSTSTRWRIPISTSSMSGRPSWWRSCKA